MTVDLNSYRWPAEWERHAGTLVAWPVNPNTWPGIFNCIPAAFATFVAALACFEPIWVLAGGNGVAKSARRLIDAACDEAGSQHPVQLLNIPVNDSWCRDYGPTIVTSRRSSEAPQAVVLNWKYNAWGGKYPPWDLDAAVAHRVAQEFDLPVVPIDLVMEGGAIEGNGAGIVLTTDSCLLNPNRNPGRNRSQIESVLCEHLGVNSVIWLPGNGIEGDDTDGHIDQLARFVDGGRVVVAAAAVEDAPEATLLRANRDVIAAFRDSRGRSLETLPLPAPHPIEYDGHRLPMSYCNFCLVNGGLLVPTFQDAADDEALRILATCFPDRAVVGVDCRDLVLGLGSLHCLSQQIPQP